MAKTEEDTVQATNDAYTGMLAISLLALLAGCAFLFLDLNQYDFKKDPPQGTKYAPPAKTAPAQQ